MKHRYAVGALAATILLGACGGSSPTNSTPMPTPAPTPTPTPTPAPTPTPCTQGLCEDPVTNTNPVARAQLRLYVMWDKDGKPVPAPDPVHQVVVEPIPVGYEFRLDVTGRDADGKETNGKGNIEWFISDANMVDVDARTPWQHDFKVVKPGKWTVYVMFDGKGSNDLSFTFVQ